MNVVITGACGGMGYATTKLLKEKGYNIYAGDLYLNNKVEGVKYFNLDSIETLEVINKQINLDDDYSKYLFVSFVLDYNVENLEYINVFNMDFTIWYELTLVNREIVNTKEEFCYKLNEIKATKHKPKLLIHSCCGPCSSYCLELLKDYFNITILTITQRVKIS